MVCNNKDFRSVVRVPAVAALVLLVGWALCGKTATAETVTYRLKWLFNISVIGDLYADAQQFFAAEGLEVDIKEGGPERDAIRELELGRAQFGVASADQVIRALAKGAEVLVLAQFFQVNPLQWIYRPDKIHIDGPVDLKGQILGVTFGGNDETILKALLFKAGLTVDDVTLFSVRYDYTPFYRKKVNFWPVYRNAQAVFISEKMRSAGETVAFFNPAVYGVRFVANSLVTSQTVLEQQPETVRKFTAALLRGWREAMQPANAPKALATLGRYDRDSSPETLSRQLEITRSLVQPDTAVPIGFIDTDAWRQTEQIMLSQNLIPAPVFVERALRPPPQN